MPGPLVANMVEGGKTPAVSRERLGELGFDLVIYANVAARAAMKAMQEVLHVLHAEGSSETVLDRIVTMAERNRLTGMDTWREFDAKYGSS